MRFFQLFYQYIIRDLLQHRLRLALTILGIALGISVVTAVHLAIDRAIGSFNNSLQTLSGQSDLEITANGLPLSEDIIRKLTWIWDFGSMTPVVEGRGVLNQSPVQVFGVDLLSESSFRRYVLSDRTDLTEQLTREEFIDLLVDPKTAI